MDNKNITDLLKDSFSNVRILIDHKDYHIEEDTRLLIPFSYKGHLGLMNRSGDVVVEPIFSVIEDACLKENDVVRVGKYFTYGFNRATKEPSTYLALKWGLVDSKGDFILEPKYRTIELSNDKQIFTVQHWNYRYEVVNKTGEVIVPIGTHRWIDRFDNGLARAINDLKWGIIDSSGNIVLPFRYSCIWNFYKKRKDSTRIERVVEKGHSEIGEFNLITHEATI